MIEPRADRPHAVTLGADKAYDAEDFVNELRSMNATPHVAQNTSSSRAKWIRVDLCGGIDMRLVRLRFSNFRSFCSDYTELELDDLTFVRGPNGAGKTAVLQALARLFSLDPAERKVVSPPL